ncbi:MAG: VWA domain-containing protein [Balneolaceae bacterium]
MSFLSPLFLIGLLAVAIPFLIHFVFRRKPRHIRFSSLALFNTLRENTLRRVRIRRWLLLALRAMVLLMLALALARPFLPNPDGTRHVNYQPGITAILIDNSPSMEQIDSHGLYFEQIQRIARGIIDRASQGDRFILEQTNGPSLSLPVLTPAAARTHLDDIEVQNRGNFIDRRVNRILDRAGQASEAPGLLFLLTDGQATQLEPLESGEPQAEMEEVQVITVGESDRANVGITSVFLNQIIFGGSGPVSIGTQLVNFHETPVENLSLSLEVEGELVGQHTVSMTPGQSEQYTFELLPAGREEVIGRFILEGDEMTFDNHRYFTLRMPRERRILHLVREEENPSHYPSFLPSLLDVTVEQNDGIVVERAHISDPILQSDEEWDGIVLDGVLSIPSWQLDELVNLVQSGTGLIFFPAPDGDLESYNRLTDRLQAGRFDGLIGEYGAVESADRMSPIRLGHPVLDDIFDSPEEELRVNLPEIYFSWRFTPSPSPGKWTLLSSQSGAPLLLEQQSGKGTVLISSIGADPGWSDFPVKPVFAPLFYRALLYISGIDEAGLQEHILGAGFRAVLDGQPEQVHIKSGDREVVPNRFAIRNGIEVRYDALDWDPGWIRLVQSGQVQQFAVNQDPAESDFNPLNPDEWMERLSKHFPSLSIRFFADATDAEFSDMLYEAGYDREIWHWFIIAAIIFLVLELLVSKLYRPESPKSEP